MSDNEKDLFSKIDALREKRAAGALVEKPLSFDDFPVLTDIIGAHPEADREAHERHTEAIAIEDASPAQTVVSESLPESPPQSAVMPQTVNTVPPVSLPDPVLLETLAHALEIRLDNEVDAWLAQQQTELKQRLRQIIHAEIRQALGESLHKK